MPAAPGSGSKAVDKLAAVTSVPEPKDINYKIVPVMWNYGSNGQPDLKFDFSQQVSALRLDLSTAQASTVEIDLEDSDFQVLSDPLFANWSFNIEDVSVDSMRKFKTTRITNSTDTAKLGDTSDLEWVLGQRPIDMQIGDVYFRLCAIQSQQTTVTVSFEDRVASKLRQKSGAKSWDRSQHTRAQFVAMLCREAGVDYFIPELDVHEPVQINGTTTSVTGHTVSSFAGCTVKGHAMTKTQTSIASLICQEGEKLNAPSDAIVAVLFDTIYESDMGMDVTSNGAYGGILGGSIKIFAPNLSSAQAEATAAFSGGQGYESAISLAKKYPGDIANIGKYCTGAINKDGSWQYQSQSVPGGIQGTVKEAEAIYAAYGGPNVTGSTTASTSTTNYAFTRGSNEDSWDCIQRLASEVAWYAFARQNKLWYVSGNYLFQQDSQLQAQINKDGVSYIDVSLDMGARDQIAQCDIYARTDLWAALPGMMVDIVNRGPATGKWMVSEVQTNPLDPTQDGQITVYKPIPKRAEPAKEDISTTPSNVAPSSNKVLSAWQAAQALSAKQLVYTQGKRTLAPLSAIPQGATWYDCSGSVSEVLWLAGFALPGGASKAGDDTPVSGDFTPGQAGLLAGPGKHLTIWGGPTHVFIEFNIPGIGHYQGNTVSGQPGFRVFPWNSPTITGGWGGPNPGQGGAGPFAPVHYPGT